jgi:hypothetical protein
MHQSSCGWRRELIASSKTPAITISPLHTAVLDRVCEFHIMALDENYTNKSRKFYIGRTDTDLKIRAVNFGRRTEYA